MWDPRTGNSGDLLLDRVQLRQLLSKDLKGDGPEPEDEHYPLLTRMYLEDEDAPAYFSFDTAFHLSDPKSLAQSWANSATSTHLMQLDYGAGSVIVLTDADLWTNRAIGRYDNAWLLWYLAQDSEVTLLFNTDHDNLLTLLWRYFPQPWSPSPPSSACGYGMSVCARGRCKPPPPGHAANCRNTCGPVPTSCSAAAAMRPCSRRCARTSCAAPANVTPVSNDSALPNNGRCSRA